MQKRMERTGKKKKKKNVSSFSMEDKMKHLGVMKNNSKNTLPQLTVKAYWQIW